MKLQPVIDWVKANQRTSLFIAAFLMGLLVGSMLT